MKILMYGWEFPPFISGGLGVACHDLTKALTEQGLDITFVLPKLKANISRESHVKLISGSEQELSCLIRQESSESKVSYQRYLEKIKLRQIDSSLRPYLNEKTYKEYIEQLEKTNKLSSEETHIKEERSFFKFELSGNYGPNLIEEVYRYGYIAGKIADDCKHDFIHIHDWMTVPAGINAKQSSGKPLIYHVHALETDRSGINVNKLIYDIEKQGLEAADKIIAVSYFTKKNIIEYYSIDPDKIDVVHNAVSKHKVLTRPSRFKKKAGEKIVLFLGRVTFQKGPDYFLEAAAKVLQESDNVRFIIAGTGDMIHRLIERAAELKIGNKVHFTGFLKRPEVEELFAASDVYVMPSVSEPFGISPLEAIFFDVPVIISRQSGVSEILNHALKVNFWDTNELANKILALLKYPALQKQLSQDAAAELKHIQWGKSAEKVKEIYQTTV